MFSVGILLAYIFIEKWIHLAECLSFFLSIFLLKFWNIALYFWNKNICRKKNWGKYCYFIRVEKENKQKTKKNKQANVMFKLSCYFKVTSRHINKLILLKIKNSLTRNSYWNQCSQLFPQIWWVFIYFWHISV